MGATLDRKDFAPLMKAYFLDCGCDPLCGALAQGPFWDRDRALVVEPSARKLIKTYANTLTFSKKDKV